MIHKATGVNHPLPAVATRPAEYCVLGHSFFVNTADDSPSAAPHTASKGGFRSLGVVMARLSLSAQFVRNIEAWESISSRLVTGTGG